MAGENVNRHLPNVQQESEGIRVSSLTANQVYAYALSQLGIPKVAVEADTSQLGVFLDKTLRTYSRWLPVEKYDVLENTTSAINRYDLQALRRPYGRGVVDARIATQEQFFSPVSGVFSLGIPHPISHLSPDHYDLALRYIKTARKVYSSSPDWQWEEPFLWVYAPSGYGAPFVVPYMYLASATRSEDIPDMDHVWVMDYFLALLKQAVGYVRSKYQGIPGPSPLQMDGLELRREGREEQDRLETELKNRSLARVPPLGPGG
jgi:hypothetical protein